MKKRIRIVLLSAALAAMAESVYLFVRQCRSNLWWLVLLGLSALALALVMRRRKIALALLLTVLALSLFRAGIKSVKLCTCWGPWDCPKGYCCVGCECYRKSDPRCGGGEDPTSTPTPTPTRTPTPTPTSTPTPTPTPMPPAIGGAVLCDQWGNAPWCRSNAVLQLTVSEPYGCAATVSGSLSPGGDFSCSGSCTLALPQGAGTAVYTVTSTCTGRSASGSTSWAYDAQPPGLTLNVSGALGDNGWYVSDASVSADASDAISGLAVVNFTVNGTSSPLSTVLGDGVYTLSLTAEDRAGNAASLSRVVSVDTTPPSVALGVNGALGDNGWYVSWPAVVWSVRDETSGLASAQAYLDGTAASLPLSVVQDGLHDLSYEAVDLAGNRSTGQRLLMVDTTPPQVEVVSWLSGRARDVLSGVAAVQVSLDGGAWSDAGGNEWSYSASSDMAYVRAVDAAGNISAPVQIRKGPSLRVSPTPSPLAPPPPPPLPPLVVSTIAPNTPPPSPAPAPASAPAPAWPLLTSGVLALLLSTVLLLDPRPAAWHRIVRAAAQELERRRE